MGQCLILEFNTESEAQLALAVINKIAATWWQSQGYAVSNNQLIGRNAKTGRDEPDKAKTLSWDNITQSPDGTFYFLSPSSDPRFINWRMYVPDGIVFPDDILFPSSWIPQDTNIDDNNL